MFEGPKRLFDWGTRAVSCGQTRRVTVGRDRIASLFAEWNPAVVVLYLARNKQKDNLRKMLLITNLIELEAAHRSIRVIPVLRTDVRQALRIFSIRNKYDVATAVAGIFPELFWRLPSRRKRWQTEPRAMVVFDAIAAGFTYWQKLGCRACSSAPLELPPNS